MKKSQKLALLNIISTLLTMYLAITGEFILATMGAIVLGGGIGLMYLAHQSERLWDKIDTRISKSCIIDRYGYLTKSVHYKAVSDKLIKIIEFKRTKCQT